jgi:hypothetical protein
VHARPRRGHAALRAGVDVAVIVTALVFIGSYFPRGVMFADTITNGGDMGSHFYPAWYLRHVLLPRGQVVGWCPGNFCGFPLFQFYFPLPFLIMAALSLVIPLTIAFKLVTVLGTFMLPPCAYLGLRLSGVPFPGPALGAVGVLPFLFMEANSMWGGNIPSTLAGEFTYSFAIALAVLFLGTLRRTVDTGRGRAWNGLLVALIGLSHGYALLWAGVTSLTEALSTRGWWRRVGTLVAVHGLAILLMAFWLIPLLAYAPWTTAYTHVWFSHAFWREGLPPVLVPLALIAVVATLLVAVGAAWRREPLLPRALAKIWAGAVVGLLFYLTARPLHVVDVRFIPFLQLGLCLAAAAALGYLLARLPMPEVWPLVGAMLVLPYLQSGMPSGLAAALDTVTGRLGVGQVQAYRGIGFIPTWIDWNYSGFERKAPWKTFKAINDHLRGTYRDPRVVYEHDSENEALGTVRAFESLPLFSGRSTLEGLYMQAVVTAPFVFYVQSEISRQQSCPFSEYGCSHFDLDRGLAHLRMFNVSQFIARSAAVRAAASRQPGLIHEFTAGEYEVYRVEGNDGRYAIPLEKAPVLVRTSTWKADAYRWFKTAGPDDPVPVFVDGEVDPADRARFAAVVDTLPAEYPSVALPTPPPPLVEEMGYERIRVSGCTPGRPVLIRISYHPRWRSLTGERVWLAAPGFMLVFPRGDTFELVFGGGLPITIGELLTAVGWAVFLVAVLPVGRRVGRAVAAVGERVSALPPISGVRALSRRLAEGPVILRRALLGLVLLATAVAFASLAYASRFDSADASALEARRLYNAGQLREALPYFRAARERAPLSKTAVNAAYFEATILLRSEDWAGAAAAFQRLVETYPEATTIAEALYQLGVCRWRLGEPTAARAAWEETRRRYPDSRWAELAGERLAETASTGS